MSLPNLANAPAEKQRTNIYTVMLMLSFAALMIGCIVFAVQWGQYETNPPWDTRAAQPVVAP